jgi:hypothetical protein
MPEGNVKITAIFTSVQWTVTFVDGFNSAVISTQQVNNGTAAIAPTPPDHSADGLTFQGWNPPNFSSVTGNLTVTAVYA